MENFVPCGRMISTALATLWLAGLPGAALAADDLLQGVTFSSAPEPGTTESPDEPPVPESWADRAHGKLHRFLWRSSMEVDSWFGANQPEQVYADQTYGSITPIVLWDEFNGLSQRLRFRVKMPLPHLDERYNAFIGTFGRDEFVTERDQESGAIPRQRTGGTIEEDQTLLGIQYRQRADGRGAGPGVRDRG